MVPANIYVAVMGGCKKNEHFHVALRRKICRNSTRLASVSSNNNFLPPEMLGFSFFEHFPFLLCRYIKEKRHRVITRLKCSTTATSKEVLPTHSPGPLQNLSLLIKLLSCHVEGWKILETKQTSRIRRHTPALGSSVSKPTTLARPHSGNKQKR